MKNKGKDIKLKKKRIKRLFVKKNYQILSLAVAILFVGFALMSFPNPENIYGFRVLVLAPIVILMGYLLVFYAILWQKK